MRRLDRTAHWMEVVALAQRLRSERIQRTGDEARRFRPQRSLKEIAKALAEAGYKSKTGKPYTATAIQRMLIGGK